MKRADQVLPIAAANAVKKRNSCKVHLIVLILLQGFHDMPYGRRKYTQRKKWDSP